MTTHKVKNFLSRPAVKINSVWLGYGLLMFTILVWSSFALFSRYAGSHSTLTAWDLCFLRFGTGTLVLLPYVIYKQYYQFLVQPRFWLLACLGGIGYASMAFLGLTNAPAVHAGIWLHGMLPVWSVVMAYLITRSPLSKDNQLSIGFIVLGILAMNYVMYLKGHFSLGIGDVYFTLGSIFWAIYAVLLKKWQMPAFQTTIAVTIVSALVYIPFYLICLPHHLAENSLTFIALQAIFQGVVVVIIAMVTYMKAIEQLGVIRSGILLSFSPLLTALLAVPLLGESLNLESKIGIFAVCIAALQPWRWFVKNANHSIKK